MVTISKNKNGAIPRYRGTQFRYSMIYVMITFIVLLFLNYYSSQTSQTLLNQSKKTSMIEKCHLLATEISALDVLNPSTVSTAVSNMGNLNVSRLLITDHSCNVIFDTAVSSDPAGHFALFPEIISALSGNDVFTSNYSDGQMFGHAATPIFSYNVLVGCVYITEYDTAQGGLIQSLQKNIFSITLVLEVVVILFSFAFSNAVTTRLRRIMTSMRIIREGDYSHKVIMGGHDELTILGDEFNDLTDRLQISERKRRQFVSDASHELKTPLASIKLLTDSILQNDMDPDTIREFVADIGNEADRLNRMSEKLLSLTRIESQEDGACEIVYMSPTIQRVVRMLDVLAVKNGIVISLDLSDDCPILILEDDLYQITFNLVENGIKYNTPGGTLTISIHRDSDNAVLTVSDTGVGIPEEAQKHVFERFYRVDKARSRKSGGSGLGLSIVRSIVERNSGTISLESAVGIGTKFVVSFPVFDTEVDKC